MCFFMFFLCLIIFVFFFFFFQAEDGIRDVAVTGVQTCALPILRDMVRISDARMSGTSYGTVALHVSPEAEAGGPLALVQDGDEIELDVPNRRLTLRVPDEELARRRARWKPRPPH